MSTEDVTQVVVHPEVNKSQESLKKVIDEPQENGIAEPMKEGSGEDKPSEEEPSAVVENDIGEEKPNNAESPVKEEDAKEEPANDEAAVEEKGMELEDMKEEDLKDVVDAPVPQASPEVAVIPEDAVTPEVVVTPEVIITPDEEQVTQDGDQTEQQQETSTEDQQTTEVTAFTETAEENKESEQTAGEESAVVITETPADTEENKETEAVLESTEDSKPEETEIKEDDVTPTKEKSRTPTPTGDDKDQVADDTATVSLTEEEKALAESSLQNQTAEKEVFDTLVNDNTKLHKDVEELEESQSSTTTAIVKLQNQLDALKDENKNLACKIVLLEAQNMKLMEFEEWGKNNGQKMKDMNVKLQDLAVQHEEKDKRIVNLEKEINTTNVRLQIAERELASPSRPRGDQVQSKSCVIS